MNRMPIATIQKAGIDLELGAADRQEDQHAREDPEHAHPARQQADADRVDRDHDHARRQRQRRQQVQVLG